MSPSARPEPIDFSRVAEAALDKAPSLVRQWLPEGVERNHRWYIGDFDGSPGKSANVCLRTGRWIDNKAPDSEKGGDLISLYARIQNLNNGQAARELMDMLGLSRPSHAPAPSPAAAPRTPPARASLPSGDAPAADDHKDAQDAWTSKWRAVVPVPAHAPAPRFRWTFRDKKAGTEVQLDAVRTWAYRRDGELLGHVARFERINSKDTLPLTWCRDTTDDRGGHRWHWKQWEAPRPLYLPRGTLRPEWPVLIVEGEKCADEADKILGDEFDVVSWPGGCKTWKLAAWHWIQARRLVIAWPDADAENERLTAEERQSGVDKSTKPVRPLQKQAGWMAMQGVLGALQAEHGCADVRVCNIGQPGIDHPPGWDVADAIADGWTAEQLRAFIAAASAFVHPDDAVRAKLAGLGGVQINRGPVHDTPPLTWHKLLLRSSTGAVKAVRDNLVLALDGQTIDDGTYIPGVPECAGVVAFNEFTNNVLKRKPAPWGTGQGVWDEVDELEMGNYLTRVHGLPSMPRGTLEEAVAMVAKRHRFHPLRARFEGLRGTWDGHARLGMWIRTCCLEEDEWDERDPLQQYLTLVGRFTVMAIVARVMKPGCKFDYMPILEGGQGIGKSTLARTLGGEYFADTGLVLGDKDSYQNLQGVSVYEWGELDSLTRAEITKVKQFISSQTDRFRASFDRRPADYPRQCIFIGTTNEDHYLVDPTGNRRFWPIRVTRHIDLAWLRTNLDQMFAEAIELLDAGERFHPNAREQKELFEPQQQQRQIENAVQAAVLRYLYDENAKFAGSVDNGTLVNDITAPELLGRIGITVDKQSHQLLRQATAALRSAGWERYRSSRGDRPWTFRRPEGAAGAHAGPAPTKAPTTAAAQRPIEEGADVDDCPF